MRMRTRKFIGTFATLAFLVCYCLAAMLIGGALVRDASRLAQMAYFIAAGFAWLPVAMLFIRWMLRPDA
jgi:hypothetical protein